MTGGMKAGFIGYRHFAETLRGLFEENGATRDFLFFHPTKKLENMDHTNKLEDLLGCDFIVIASPDETHGQYLRRLQDYGGYVFCEKIPVTTWSDLKFLKEHPNQKLYFDFCYRKSHLYPILKEKQSKILHINHKCSHGLALKEEYRGSWRSKAAKAPLGVFQLSGIHFFDLLVFCFGRPVSYHTAARNLSPNGDSIDNFSISLEFKNGITSNLFYSYTSPYCLSTEIVTTDELIVADSLEFSVFGPRETFDKKGRFTAPPLLSKQKTRLYEDSLKNRLTIS
ncbi:MAG: Gfo/Idh/MocA family oxidoreductase [Candidatus Diapherotrites archaeon]|nr:Gfo/Idh/MocA family oxidoreductase [Candidatus Diapherotrites archaeon]